MKNLVFIPLIIILAACLFSSCGQTDEDIAHTEMVLGYWKPVDSEGNIVIDVPLYMFDTANNGYSQLLNETDTFKWEIKRGQLKVYYETAPSYYIGYDKYNSRSQMKIKEVNTDSFRVTQFYSDGFQREITFQRYYPEEL